MRVKSKFNNIKHHLILLPSDSHLSKILVRDLHEKFMHAGVYVVLRELRKNYWILRGFSSVRKILKHCVPCKKLNERPVKLNQNSYREFRTDPPKLPFSSIFLDYIGPINVRMCGTVKKVWLMIITCLWSRAVSLQVCFSADTKEFLRAMQTYIYEYGIFSFLFVRPWFADSFRNKCHSKLFK